RNVGVSRVNGDPGHDRRRKPFRRAADRSPARIGRAWVICSKHLAVIVSDVDPIAVGRGGRDRGDDIGPLYVRKGRPGTPEDWADRSPGASIVNRLVESVGANIEWMSSWTLRERRINSGRIPRRKPVRDAWPVTACASVGRTSWI